MTTRLLPLPFLPAVALGLIVFAGCLLGIAARLGMDLSNLWIANALLLGMLIRFPALNTPGCWFAATLAFLSADLITGSNLVKTLVLTAGNLSSVCVAHMLLSRLNRRDQRLQRPRSMLRVLFALVLACTVAGLFGLLAEPWLFGAPALSAAGLWFTTELVNYLLVLPALLTLPEGISREQVRARLSATVRDLRQLAPAASLLASILIGLVVGGPGAVAFPVPALLWCALSYSMFTNALMVLCFGAWTLLAASSGYLLVAPDMDTRTAQLSFRLGVSLIMLAPLALASTMAAREQLLGMLRFMADHDDLTGMPNRSAFLRRARESLRELARRKQSVSVMMIDIDRFKSINDRFGHASGDQVLVSFSTLLRRSLRGNDHAARIGGEEFAVVLPACSAQRAHQIAERIQRSVREATIALDNGTSIRITTSIGTTTCMPTSEKIDDLLAAADLALYRAKAAGRDRIEFATPAQMVIADRQTGNRPPR